MKKEAKYLLFLIGAALIYISVKLFSPRDFDWTVTYHKDDRNPFGAYILNELIDDVFPDDSVIHSYKTIYELYDSLQEPVNFLSITNFFDPDKNDVEVLLKNIEQGGNALIASQYFGYVFSDTMKVQTNDYYFKTDFSPYTSKSDTAELKFTNPGLIDNKTFLFPRNNIHHYFNVFDSTNTSVIAVNDLDLPVTIHIKWGKGNLYLNSTPIIFTNAYLISGDNPDFVSRSLSLMPHDDVLWSEFYHLGRLEASTPLRFILITPPLKWAYYLLIVSLIVFVIFEAKRKQRIIPVIKPLANNSLEFVTTIGNLYLQNGDHKDMAEKKISYFLEHIRSAYWLHTNKITPDFILILSKRSGKPADEIRKLFNLIGSIQIKISITEEELIALNKAIEDFNKK